MVVMSYVKQSTVYIIYNMNIQLNIDIYQLKRYACHDTVGFAITSSQ